MNFVKRWIFERAYGKTMATIIEGEKDPFDILREVGYTGSISATGVMAACNDAMSLNVQRRANVVRIRQTIDLLPAHDGPELDDALMALCKAIDRHLGAESRAQSRAQKISIARGKGG